VPAETVYVNVPIPPAAARLKTNGVPAVADCVPDGAIKLTAGLITSVGSEVAVSEPRLFVATTVTTTNRPSSALVNKRVLEVAPVMSVQVVGSAGLVQDFH
jgi:hypothetical protein